MSGLSWFMLSIAVLIVADAAFKTTSVIRSGRGSGWVGPFMIAATLAQAAIFGWVFWETLQ